jgi:hypothetical protein
MCKCININKNKNKNKNKKPSVGRRWVFWRVIPYGILFSFFQSLIYYIYKIIAIIFGENFV